MTSQRFRRWTAFKSPLARSLIAGAAAAGVGVALALATPASGSAEPPSAVSIAATPTGTAFAARPGTANAAVPASTSTDRGSLVSLTRLRSLSAARAARIVRQADFDPAGIHHRVDRYRLVYSTVDPRGRRTTASGLLAVPRSSRAALRPVVFLHGSEVYRGDAPSVSTDPWVLAPALTFAGTGYAAIAPDYLGLGVGPGPHPWLDLPSEVTASVDMLRASRTALARLGRPVRPDVLVTGFSQGGSAALGLARAIDQDPADRFRLAAVAPISGAYAVRGAEIPALLHGDLDPQWSVAYTAYLLVAWNRLHGLYDSPSEVFKGPYDRTIEALFDSNHPGEEVLGGLPARIGDLLTPHGVELLEHPHGALAAALAVSDSTCTDWTPRALIRLYVATKDEQVAPGNTERCRIQLGDAGVTAPVINLGPVGHLDTNRLGTASIRRWFDELG